ncbi:MAG TPA: ABC transporter permease subunit, partial [Acidimicrobiia bacterium]|nr:ABC transporter permease subunit [Acidimicrobiia bacterium]
MRSPAKLRERAGRALLVAIPLLFLGYFFAYPLGAILTRSLFQSGHLDLAPFADVFRRSTLRGAIWFTVWQATASMLLTLAVALPAAYVFARYRFPGKRLLRAAITVPFVLPTVVVGSAFLTLLGPTGLVDLSGTVWLILIAHVFFNYAIVVRTVGGFWANLDPRLEEAARMLGAGRWRAFRTVTLPLLRPALAAAGSIVFLFTFTSFGVILILGGLQFATIEVEIWRQTISYLQLPIASALAVIQLVGVSSILFVYSRYQQRDTVE